jgi:3-methyl-2-oxobutanoate hydroxymethyltransferase
MADSTEASGTKGNPRRPISINALHKRKKKGQKISVLTAYDYPFARLADMAGIDIILVSDVLGQVGLGYDSTVPVTLEEMAHHTKAVKKGVSHALVITKIPFLSASFPTGEVMQAASVLVKEAGCRGVEVEGGPEILPLVETLVTAGIPVMPHIGLTAQHFMRTGSFKVQGSTAEDAKGLLDFARRLEEAGVFAIMLECVPAELGQVMTEALSIPVLGIGSGPYCDGQILVPQDMLGLFEKFVPKFVKVYKNMGEEILEVFRTFKEEVESSHFPEDTHSYSMDTEELTIFKSLLENP